MMRIERRAARPRRAAMRSGCACGPIEREAGLGLPRQVPARIMLGDEFHITVGDAAVFRLVLDLRSGSSRCPSMIGRCRASANAWRSVS